MEKVSEYFKKYPELQNDRIAIAFSGGSDSLALLFLLSQYLDNKKLVAIYVNHGLRDDNELLLESEKNKYNCKSIGVEYKEIVLEKGQVEKQSQIRNNGIEDAARYLRYKYLIDYCKDNNIDAIATAHTIDDQLETMIMRSFNGSSLLSLTCIKEYRIQDSIKIVRPLLAYSKDNLKLLLKVAGLTWCEDSTNAKSDYLRNRIRQEISPKVEAIFPDAKKIVHRNALLFTGLVSLAEERVNSLIENNVVNRKQYLLQEDIIRYNVLSRLIKKFEVPSFKKIVHLDNVIKKINSDYQVFGNIKLLIKDDTFVINRYNEIFNFSFVIKTPSDQVIDILERKMVITSKDEYDSSLLRIDDDDISYPLIVRNIRSDDSLIVDKGTVEISKFLTSWKMNEEDRKKVIVLEDKSGIIAIFAKHLGGRDRLAKRVKNPLVGKSLRIYSIV